ncbi:MAG: protein-disulfide reductase DsbD family protein [Candidatus Puniceispirillales bacterium]
MKTLFSSCLIIFLTVLLPVSAQAAVGPWQGNDVMQARLITAVTAAGEERVIEAGLEFRLEPGWKVYWRSPGDAGLPPVLDFSDSGEIIGHQLAFPAPKRFSILGFDSFGYGEEVILPLSLERRNPGRPMTVQAQLDGLVCSDVCIPVAETLTLFLPGGKATASAEARRIALSKARVPGPGTAAGQTIAAIAVDGGQVKISLGRDGELVSFHQGDVLIEAASGFGFAKPDFRGGIASLDITGRDAAELIGEEVTVTVITPAALIEERHVLAAGGIAAINPWQGVGLMLMIAFIGGVILNVMPCVLPVLSLKLAAVLGHGGSAQRAVRVSFLATAAGVVFSFLLLGTVLLALRQAGVVIGWGIQFQHPGFLLVAAGVIGFFGLVMLDLVPLPVPTVVQNLAARMPRSGLAGDFASGALATLLATPCSAPFVGTAMAFALAAPALPLLAVFLAMGLGLALPWLVVALRPGLVIMLPKPGGWLIWLKRGLALGLFITAAWLMTIMASLGEVEPGLDQGWQPWQPGAEAAAVAAGRVVLVDVTADWCITCKTNKVLVLDTDTMQQALDDAGVVRLQADWTRPDEAISRYLASFGRYGIPFNAVYGPAAPEGIPLPELLTRDAVLEAVKAAAGGA